MAVSIVIMVLLNLFTKKGKMGKAMRAVSEDKDAAQLMGINTNATISMTFAIGSALAAVAGVLLCSAYPMLTPTTFFVFVMLVIQSFNAFDQIKVMTDGGPMNATTTVVHQIYQRAFMFYDMGSASAMTAILVVITATLSLLNFR